MAIMNNAQLSASPCLTPLWMENEFDRKPFTCTWARRLLCKMLTALINSSGKPYTFRVFAIYEWSTLS